jgi:hypothetical protein
MVSGPRWNALTVGDGMKDSVGASAAMGSCRT